jgi:hypothetical protein
MQRALIGGIDCVLLNLGEYTRRAYEVVYTVTNPPTASLLLLLILQLFFGTATILYRCHTVSSKINARGDSWHLNINDVNF